MDLDNWPVVIEDITELYGKEWKYSATENVNANRKKLDKFYRTGMSKKITLQVYADTKEEYCDVMDQLNEITDIDIIEKKPGKLWVGDYYLECYITELNPKEYDEIFYTVDVDAISTTPFVFTVTAPGGASVDFTTAMADQFLAANAGNAGGDTVAAGTAAVYTLELSDGSKTDDITLVFTNAVTGGGDKTVILRNKNKP